MQLFGFLALALCLLLAAVPLYFVSHPDGIGPHWSTLFDLASDRYILPPNLIGGRWLSHTSILWMRYGTLLIVMGIITICMFKRFRLRWLPLLILGVVSDWLVVGRFYPRLGGDEINMAGFGLLVGFCLATFGLFVVHCRYRDS